MNQIIPIGKHEFSGSLKQTVNARELHGFLGNRDHFSTWIKDRISQYYFIENQDFVIASGFSEAKRGGHNRVEYFLTLDMAKELSMVERTDKGKQARQYFIECERRAQSAAPAIPQTLPEALRLAADLAEQNQQQAARLAIAEPKAAFADAVSGSSDVILIRDMAKILKQNGVEIGEKRLFVWLRENKYLTQNNLPTQKAMDLKVFRVTETVVNTPKGSKVNLTAKVTGKGQTYFLDKFLKGGVAA